MRILGFDSLDTEEAMRLFVKGAETSMDLSASAEEHMQMGDCKNASLFAMRAAEEIGSVRGVMSQVAVEVRETERDIRRVGRREELIEQKERLQTTLTAMREDFDFIQHRRSQIFEQFANRCACGTPDPIAPSSFTTRPSDGEDDG